ncbi:MAG: membrane protein insertase YidC [Parcubacteria group bacterium]|nr:membrane protein insertase YidC [Parcubacteria group bacterium]
MTYLLIYQPLYNILALLSFLFRGNVGWAIFVLAILIRLALLPLNRKNTLEQTKLAKVQPELKEIQKKYKNDPLKANQLTRELFQREKLSLSGPFVGIFIQLGIFIFLFIFFRQAITLTDWSVHFYPFLHFKLTLNYIFLGFIHLQNPNLLLVIISAILNIISALLQPTSGKQNKTMLILFPLIILAYWKVLPAAIVVYWIAMTLVGIFEALISKKTLPQLEATTKKV